MSAWIAGIASNVLELAFSLLWERGETHPKPPQRECMTRTTLLPWLVKPTPPGFSYVNAVLYLQPICISPEWSVTSNRTPSRMTWGAVPFGKPSKIIPPDGWCFGWLFIWPRSHRQIYPSDTGERWPAHRCENSNYHSQSPSRTKSIKGDWIDALDTSKGTWFRWEKSTNLPPRQRKLLGRGYHPRSSLHTSESGRKVSTGRKHSGSQLAATATWFYIE